MSEIVKVSAVTGRYPVVEVGNIPTVKIDPETNVIPAHHLSHEVSGDDEINVGGLAGLLADPQTPLATSGNWTPVLGGADGTSGQTYSAQQGFYLKIGNLVWVFCRVVLSAKGTITGNVEIQGFPFTFKGGGVYIATAPCIWAALNTGLANMIAVGLSGTTKAMLVGRLGSDTSMATANLTTTIILNTTDISFSMVYSI